MAPCFQISMTVLHRSSCHTMRSCLPAPKLASITLGEITLDVPIILAPMAAVTNPPFRKLCSKHGARLTISEMLHAPLYLANRTRPRFNAYEKRSVQLYGTDAGPLSAAAMRLVEEEGVEHIDLNFGCPAPKILRRGGGAAVAGDMPRFSSIIRGVVRASAGAAVTCKLRAGYAGRETFREAGVVAQACGAAAVTLHSRMAEELYDRGAGRAAWWRIGELVAMLEIPVFGNGDVFRGIDAVDMVRETGCAGVVVGRGCLGRPWLFTDIDEAFRGVADVTVPGVAVVFDVMIALVEETVTHLMTLGMGERGAVRAVRKWYGWFLQGYRGCEGLLDTLVKAERLEVVKELVAGFAGPVEVDFGRVIAERGKLGRE